MSAKRDFYEVLGVERGASAEEDVVFFVAKDTRHGLAGPPVDGIEDGPRYLPGFGPAK